MKKHIGILGVALILTATQAFAQHGPVMSLKECINYSLTNNPSGSVYANQVGIAQQQNREGLAGYLPQVNLTGSLDDNLKRQVTIIPAGTFGPEPTKVQFGNQYASTVTGQLDQVIYDQTLINALKASKMNVELAELKLEKNEDDIIYNTASAYYQVLIYREQLKLVLENERKMEQLVAVQKLQFDIGVLQESSYKRVLVNYNNVKAQYDLTQMNLEMALTNLKHAMGMSADDPLDIADSIDFEKDVPMPSNEKAAITQKADYRILQQNILLQEIDLKRKRA